MELHTYDTTTEELFKSHSFLLEIANFGTAYSCPSGKIVAF